MEATNMKPSRRDSNRTQNDYLVLLAKRAKRDGQSETDFVSQFVPPYQPLARKAYQEAQ